MNSKLIRGYLEAKQALYEKYDNIPSEWVEGGLMVCRIYPNFYKKFCGLLGDAVVSDRELAAYYITIQTLLKIAMEELGDDMV
jgi:hypothetical protein